MLKYSRTKLFFIWVLFPCLLQHCENRNPAGLVSFPYQIKQHTFKGQPHGPLKLSNLSISVANLYVGQQKISFDSLTLTSVIEIYFAFQDTFLIGKDTLRPADSIGSLFLTFHATHFYLSDTSDSIGNFLATDRLLSPLKDTLKINKNEFKDSTDLTLKITSDSTQWGTLQKDTLLSRISLKSVSENHYLSISNGSLRLSLERWRPDSSRFDTMTVFPFTFRQVTTLSGPILSNTTVASDTSALHQFYIKFNFNNDSLDSNLSSPNLHYAYLELAPADKRLFWLGSRIPFMIGMIDQSESGAVYQFRAVSKLLTLDSTWLTQDTTLRLTLDQKVLQNWVLQPEKEKLLFVAFNSNIPAVIQFDSSQTRLTLIHGGKQ